MASYSEERPTLRSCQWTLWDDCGFPERVNHAVASDCTSSMYAMGGFKGRGRVAPGGYESWNDLGSVPLDVLKMDIETSTWERIYPSKSVEIRTPSCQTKDDDFSESSLIMEEEEGESNHLPGRYAHSCVWYKNKLYMYGGRSDYIIFDQIECFDIEKGSWSLFKTKTENDEAFPQGRYAHGCTLNGPIMYIQGGTKVDAAGHILFKFVYTGDLISCNLETGIWRDEPVAPSEERLPLERDFHSAVYTNGRIVIFGGKRPYPKEDDDGFYEYNFGTHRWSRLITTGYQPPGRRSLQGVSYGENSVIYFGGFSTTQKIFYSDLFILNTDTKHVLKLIPYGLGPCPRRRVGMCLIGSDLVICGGVGRNQAKESHFHTLMTFGDTYTLHLVSSLQHMCREAVIKYKLSVDILPTPIQQTIYSMTTESVNDCQPLKGDLYIKA